MKPTIKSWDLVQSRIRKVIDVVKTSVVGEYCCWVKNGRADLGSLGFLEGWYSGTQPRSVANGTRLNQDQDAIETEVMSLSHVSRLLYALQKALMSDEAPHFVFSLKHSLFSVILGYQICT